MILSGPYEQYFWLNKKHTVLYDKDMKYQYSISFFKSEHKNSPSSNKSVFCNFFNIFILHFYLFSGHNKSFLIEKNESRC